MTILNLSVGAGADDGYSTSGGLFNVLSDELKVGFEGVDLWDSFYRFVDVTIPQQATIDVAYLTYVDVGGAGPATFQSRIYLNDTDNAVAPTTSFTHTEKVRTAAFTVFDNLTGRNTEGTVYNTPSLVVPVQEVIDRPGWASGNALMVLWDSVEPSVGYLEVAALEHILLDYPPAVLHVEYSLLTAPGRSIRKPPR